MSTLVFVVYARATVNEGLLAVRPVGGVMDLSSDRNSVLAAWLVKQIFPSTGIGSRSFIKRWMDEGRRFIGVSFHTHSTAIEGFKIRFTPISSFSASDVFNMPAEPGRYCPSSGCVRRYHNICKLSAGEIPL
jgi:hypothetical protein